MTRAAPSLVFFAVASACLGGCGALGDEPLSGTFDGGTTAADASTSQFDAGTSYNADAGGLTDGGADQCNPVTQTGCAPPQTKCVVEGTRPGASCVAPGLEDRPLGAACEGQDCEAGLACVLQTSTSTASTCVMVCDFASGEGCASLGAEYECRTRLGDTRWGACQALPPVCDPYSQYPCDAEQACQPFLRRTGTWEFRCRTAGTGGEGDVCGPGNPACARELACVSSRTGAAVCRRICQLSQDCPDPAQCNGVVSEPAFMYCSE